MSFPINTGVPAANNNPSVDQQPMQDNFANINSWGAIDHVGYGVSADAGKHKQVTIPTPISDPSLSGTVGEIYTKTVSGLTQLYFANATTVFAITNSLSASVGSGGLPGGLQIRSGTATAATGAGNPVSFNTAFPTGCISVVVSYSGGGFTGNVQTASAGNVSASGFNAISSGGATGIYYIAIGY